MVYRMTTYTDFTKVFFYIQNTTWFHSTDVNVISFMPVPIFRKLINAYTADHLYQIAPKLDNKHEST